MFGGGCFWCADAIFKMLKGIVSVTSGYAGGHTKNPTYENTSSGDTGHAEVVKIEFNPSFVSFKDLLTVFFGTHDATQVNRQGADVGPQYRSIILYTNEMQKKEAEAFIAELNTSASDGKPIATEVVPLEKFYPAEGYHQDYYNKNPNQGYCQVIIAPKLQKVQEKFADLLKIHST